MTHSRKAEPATHTLLKHWRESVPDDRLAHLIRDVARAQMRALQQRLLAMDGVSEAMVVPEERSVYVKIDSKVTNRFEVEQVVAG